MARGSTLKYSKKFTATPAPAPTTPKAPSPRATGGTPTAPSSTTAPTKPTTTRRIITQQEAGQIAQETFRTKVQSLTASLRSQRADTVEYLSGSIHPRTRLHNEEKLRQIDAEIAQIETEQHEAVLATNINQIIQAIESGQVLVPDYFQNNIAWVKSGAITYQAFLDAYYYLSKQGIIHSAPTEPEIIETKPEIIEPEPDSTVLLSANVKISFTNPNIGGFSSSIPIGDIGELQGLSNASDDWKYILIGSSTTQPISTLSELIMNINDLLTTVEPEPDITITDKMITQKVNDFEIINGRVKGSITFMITDQFNPYYYNKEIISYLQLRDDNGETLVLKRNVLRFSESEIDETIFYDESSHELSKIFADSFVWDRDTQPTPFSTKLEFIIEIGKLPSVTPITAGFMGAGGLGAVAFLVLIGAAFTIKGD